MRPAVKLVWPLVKFPTRKQSINQSISKFLKWAKCIDHHKDHYRDSANINSMSAALGVFLACCRRYVESQSKQLWSKYLILVGHHTTGWRRLTLTARDGHIVSGQTSTTVTTHVRIGYMINVYGRTFLHTAEKGWLFMLLTASSPFVDWPLSSLLIHKFLTLSVPAYKTYLFHRSLPPYRPL